MSKHVKQFRYFGVGNNNNYPIINSSINISENTLAEGAIFNNYTPIVKLGIQSLPGTRFYINDTTKQNPIIIGYTGLYELDIDGIAEINTLSFDKQSLERINNIPEAYLIIDIIYEKEGE